MEARARFFSDVRACRRREAKEWQGQSVARLLTSLDEFPQLQQRAAAARIANLMRDKVWGA